MSFIHNIDKKDHTIHLIDDHIPFSALAILSSIFLKTLDTLLYMLSVVEDTASYALPNVSFRVSNKSDNLSNIIFATSYITFTFSINQSAKSLNHRKFELYAFVNIYNQAIIADIGRMRALNATASHAVVIHNAVVIAVAIGAIAT